MELKLKAISLNLFSKSLVKVSCHALHSFREIPIQNFHTLLIMLLLLLLLLQNKSSEYCAPLTSFDWNETDTKILDTSSIDTTCTIWELQVKHTLVINIPLLNIMISY